MIISLAAAIIVFGLDYLVRRKKWKENSKEEKISLIVNMFSVGPYAFLSALGVLWGIVTNSAETDFGKILNDVTLFMGETYFIIAFTAIILSFIFRKKGEFYQLDLVLRNNITTEERPLGVYHPNPSLHHIKKENIGLIEVMGLAVLPGRLNK